MKRSKQLSITSMLKRPRISQEDEEVAEMYSQYAGDDFDADDEFEFEQVIILIFFNLQLQIRAAYIAIELGTSSLNWLAMPLTRTRIYLKNMIS